MASITSEDIRIQFKSATFQTDKVVEECVNICHIYNLTTEELYWKWEALRFTTGQTKNHSELISEVTMDAIGAIKQAILRDRRSTTTGQQHGAQRRKKRDDLLISANVGVRRNMPAYMSRNLAASGAALNVSVKQEAGVEKVERVEGMSGVVESSSLVEFQCASPTSDRSKNRYMREKMKDRSIALDTRIRSFARLISTHYNVPIDDPTTFGGNEIVAVGRITQDSDSTDASRINESTLTLEPSHLLSNLPRIPLRFEPNLKIRGAPRGVLSMGLFPGAIVAVKGKNSSGEWFSVSEILSLPPPEPRSTVSPGAPFTMVVASGPFTPDSDLEYKPFAGFLRSIQSSNPSVILLLGPFVDAQHSKIKVGDVDHGPEEMCQRFIIQPLKQYLDDHPGITALVVPNVRDLVSAHSVFPQAELDSTIFGNDSRIKLLSNPARFSLNGLTFGAMSIDVVFQLKTQELVVKSKEQVEPIAAAPDDGDPFGSVCRHLLQQRSFYPLFPVPSDSTPEVHLDVAFASAKGSLRLTESAPPLEGAEGMKPKLFGARHTADENGYGDTDCYSPDVLVLPSRMKQFSKIVHSTVAVNPSFLAKGTYSLLNINPSKPVNSGERVRVEVVKLG